MGGKKNLSDRELLEQPYYKDIMSLLFHFHIEEKKVKFKHLEYALVKNGYNIPKKKKKEMDKFFGDTLDELRLREGFEKDKISTKNNLWNTYLKTLIERVLITPDYKPTMKGLEISIIRGIHFWIDSYIENQFYDLFNVKDGYTKEYIDSLFKLKKDIHKSVNDIIKKKVEK